MRCSIKINSCTKLVNLLLNQLIVNDMFQQSLVVFLVDIEDTRKAKGRYYQQLSILVILNHGNALWQNEPEKHRLFCQSPSPSVYL